MFIINNTIQVKMMEWGKHMKNYGDIMRETSVGIQLIIFVA